MKEIPIFSYLAVSEEMSEKLKDLMAREKLGGNEGVHLVVKHDPPSEKGSES